MDAPTPLDDNFPIIPTFTDQLWERCRKAKDFRSILFEWYKFVGITCNIIASISIDPPAIRIIPELHYAILSGLLNRCSRLMLANIRLASTKKYGETIMLIDRSIYESLVIVRWLCYKNNDDCFKRYLADGIKSDLKLYDHIAQSISDRGGKAFKIEKEMLTSIQECIESTGLSKGQILAAKSLPDLFSMCRDIGLSERFYLGAQRMGSHATHGTWTSLRSHYLKQDETGRFSLRDHDVPTHENQLMVIPIVLLDTLKIFIHYIVPNEVDRTTIEHLLDNSISEMNRLAKEIVSTDFSIDF